ncbi:MAG: diaminopimelate epimerase [Chloroflexi bacterium]|nr:diaminopimelate epimerase [Chloroflexota bacterium]
MQFTKMHGTGNDFVLIDARDANRNGEPRDWAAFARWACDRHFGVGGDGILLIRESSAADFRMQMINPDGSEAEMCGNGIRCFGKYLFERGLTGRRDLTVETGAGIKRLEMRGDGNRVAAVHVRMGVPILNGRAIPVALDREPVLDHPLTVEGSLFGRQLAVTCVSMGNPHAVAFLEGPVAEFPLETLGPRVERHELFPRRVNLEVARLVGTSESGVPVIEARVWERGAGLTLACGTGACAVAVAAKLRGLIDQRAIVHLPGGPLDLAWDGQGEVSLTGPAEFVFDGRIL